MVRWPFGRRLDVEAEPAAPAGGDVDVAWSKSSASIGSFGCVSVDVVEGEEKPWNCDVRSSYCFCRPGRESDIVSAPLREGM